MAEDDTIVEKLVPQSAKRPERPCITVLSGEMAGALRRVEVGDTIIGRAADAGLRLVEAGVSRHHAKVVLDPDATAKIVDLASTNGTYVNGRRVTAEVLREGDRIRIGKHVTLDFSYEDPNADVETSAISVGGPSASGGHVGSAGGSGLGPVRAGGSSHLIDSVAATMDSLGRFYTDTQQYDRALRAYRRTLGLRQERSGSDHPSVAAIHDAIGEVLHAKGDDAEALLEHERALAIYERDTAGSQRELVRTLICIGECRIALGQLAEARPSLERALAELEHTKSSETALARPRFALAQALVSDRGAAARVRRLAELARAGYASGDPRAKLAVTTVDQFLARLGTP